MTVAERTSIDVLEDQLALFREVEAVTREQFACLERGDYAEVVIHLRRRHALLDRLERLVAAPPPPARDEDMIRSSAMNDEIGRLLTGIISSDEMVRIGWRRGEGRSKPLWTRSGAGERPWPATATKRQPQPASSTSPHRGSPPSPLPPDAPHLFSSPQWGEAG
jgi:hypothetical protein